MSNWPFSCRVDSTLQSTKLFWSYFSLDNHEIKQSCRGWTACVCVSSVNIQVETLTQNHLSPPPCQQAERPVLICARCKSTIKTEIMITSIPDRDVCETFKQRNEVISSFICFSLCERGCLQPSPCRNSQRSCRTWRMNEHVWWVPNWKWTSLQSELGSNSYWFTSKQSSDVNHKVSINSNWSALCVSVYLWCVSGVDPSRSKMPMMCWLCLWSGSGKSRSVQLR